MVLSRYRRYRRRRRRRRRHSRRRCSSALASSFPLFFSRHLFHRLLAFNFVSVHLIALRDFFNLVSTDICIALLLHRLPALHALLRCDFSLRRFVNAFRDRFGFLINAPMYLPHRPTHACCHPAAHNACFSIPSGNYLLFAAHVRFNGRIESSSSLRPNVCVSVARGAILRSSQRRPIVPTTLAKLTPFCDEKILRTGASCGLCTPRTSGARYPHSRAQQQFWQHLRALVVVVTVVYVACAVKVC